MAYEKQTWTDGTSIANAERLNHIEDGIYDNAIENGNNTNGKYIKFNDGTLICYTRLETTASGDTGGIFDSWTFPVEFNDIPNVQATNLYYATPNIYNSVGITTKTTTDIYWRYAGSGTVTGTVSVNVMAIGRWK